MGLARQTRSPNKRAAARGACPPAARPAAAPPVNLAARGHCPACGCDCRATPDRCPECGTVASGNAEAQRG